MLLKPFFIFLGVFLFNVSSFAGGSTVGNGGFGVWRGNKLELYDLVEAGVTPQRSTIVGVRGFHPKIYEIARSLHVNEDLLEAKLQELDFVLPEFGTLMAEVIAFYEWEMRPRILTKTKDACPGCTQIAVRSAQRIEVNGAAWRVMNQDHRIALLIHEAAFALMRTDRCSRQDDLLACDDVVFKDVRALVASMFAEPFKNMKALRRSIQEFLNINSETLCCWAPNSAKYQGEDGVVLKLTSAAPLGEDQIAKFAEDVCEASKGSEFIQIDLTRTPLKLIPSVLRNTLYGPQHFLELLGRSMRKGIALYPRTAEECRHQIVTKLAYWFTSTEDSPGVPIKKQQ